MARIPWLQIDTDLPDHPKVRRLADILGIERDYALGRILRFWCEVARYYPSGDFSGVPDSEVARCFRWKYGVQQGRKMRVSSGTQQGDESQMKGTSKGYRRDLSPIQVLDDCGLFNRETREVHDWKHIYRHILKSRERKAAWKAKNVPGDGSGNVPRARAKEKSREEKSTSTSPLPPEGGPAPSAPRGRKTSPKTPPECVVVPDDLARFAPQLGAWFRYKHERREDYTPTGLSTVWERARDLGDQLPQALQEAMASNYAGFFAPKGKPAAAGGDADERRIQALTDAAARQLGSWNPENVPTSLEERRRLLRGDANGGAA